MGRAIEGREGALALIAVPHQEADYRVPQRNAMQKRATLAQQSILADLPLLAKISELLSQ